MIAWWLLVGTAVPWLAAYALVRRCDANARNDAATAWLHALLALGLALGLSSCSYFVGLLVAGGLGRGYCMAEIAGFAGLGLVCWLAPRGSRRVGGARKSMRDGALRDPVQENAERIERLGSLRGPPSSHWLASRTLQVVFLGALISAILGIAGMLAVEPHGDWDAWNIWTMRARFLFRSGHHWRNAFAPIFEHTDYPLLLSGSIARCWTWLAAEPHWIPQLIAAAFTLLGAGLLTAGVARLRGSNQGWLAGLSLLGTVLYLVRGAALYADVPLSFFILATLLLLALYDAGDRPSPGLRILAGLTAALAAWTKNEGAMFLAIVLVVRTLLTWRRAGGRAALRQAGALLAGAAPVVAVVVLFKVSIAAENDLVAGQSWHALLPRLADPSRIAFILESFLGSLWHVGRALVVILPLALLILGGAPDRRAGVLPGLVGVLGAMLAGYFFVYLSTPHDLAWHVNTSMDRLLIHLWPSMLLAVFLYLGDPTRCS